MEWFFKHFHQVVFGIIVLVVTLALLFYGAVGVAVYWGLSIADDAMHGNSGPTTVYVEEL